VDKKAANDLPEPEVTPCLKGVEFDEMRHFLGKKNKLWIWRAVECAENKTVGWFVGDRSAATFEKFFERFRGLEYAFFYTDDYEAYRKIILNPSMS